MRKFLMISTLPLFFAATPAFAQAEPAVDDYKCTFLNQCEDEEKAPEEPTVPAPETKGFKLAAPSAGAAAPAKPPVVASSGATRQGREVAAVGKGKAPKIVTAPKAVKATTVQPGAGRADLRLSFGLGSAQLDSDGLRRAKVFADFLKTDVAKGKTFLIEGHTDSLGGRASNLQLSQKRAQAVADYLTGQGVPASMLQVKGYGYDKPLSGKKVSSADNRRVEAVLIK